MIPAVDQFTKVTKTSVEDQLQAMTVFADKTLHGVAELVELNMATAKASMEEATAAVQHILTAKDAQEAFSLAQSHVQPGAEKALSYGRHLAAIATKAQAEMTQVTQARVTETSRHINTLVDDLTKAAPAGSEQFVQSFKASVANSSAMYEQFVKASQNAFNLFQNNLNQASNHFADAAPKAPKSKK